MLEPGSNGGAEVVETNRFVKMIIRNEVESIFMDRNCVLEVTRLSEEALEMSEETVSQVDKIAGLLKMTTMSEVNRFSSEDNGCLKIRCCAELACSESRDTMQGCPMMRSSRRPLFSTEKHCAGKDIRFR